MDGAGRHSTLTRRNNPDDTLQEMKSKRSVDVPAGRGLPDVLTKEISYG